MEHEGSLQGHRIPPLDVILSQLNILTTYFWKIHFKYAIIVPPARRSSKIWYINLVRFASVKLKYVGLGYVKSG
jgi:hypothetical protein